VTAVFKTNEVQAAIIAKLKAATFSFVPKIVEPGFIPHLVRDRTLSDTVPAIFVHALVNPIHIADGTDLTDSRGHIVGSTTDYRIVLVNSWDAGDDPVTEKQTFAQEIAQELIGGPGYAYTLLPEFVTAGYDIKSALPLSIEYLPPEHGAISQNEEERLYAVAINVRVEGRAVRT
jgi:hypothetical protein